MSFFGGLAQGFVSGYKVFQDEDDIKYKKLRNKMLEAQTVNIADPETRAARIAVLKGQAGYYGAAATMAGPRAELMKAQIADYKARTEGTGIYAPQPTATPENVGAVPTSSVTQPVVQPGEEAGLAKGGTVPEGTVSRLANEVSRGTAIPPKRNVAGPNPTNFSAGGNVTEGQRTNITHAVPGYYADGGEVEDDEDDNTALSYAAGSDLSGDDDDELPANATPTAGRSSLGYSMLAGHDATRSGLLGAQRMVGLGGPSGMPSPRSQAAYQHYLRGIGAASPQEAEAIKNAIDPKHQMPEDQRNMAALSKIWTYYMRQGDPQAAQRSAIALVQNYRIAAGHYAALASVALQNGDLDESAKEAMKAYGYVPDGRNIKLGVAADKKHLHYTYTDENGITVQKGLMTPDELAQKLSSFGGGAEFDKTIMGAAGMRGAGDKETKGKGGGLPKMSDYKTANELIENASPTDKEGKADPALKNDALKLFTNPENRKNGLTHYDAVEVAGALRGADKSTKIMRDKEYEGPGVKLRVPVANDKFRDVFLTDEQWERFNTATAAKLKDGTETKGGLFGGMSDLAGDVAGGYKAWMEGKEPSSAFTPGGVMDKVQKVKEARDRERMPFAGRSRGRGGPEADEVSDNPQSLAPSMYESDPSWRAASASAKENPNEKVQTAIPEPPRRPRRASPHNTKNLYKHPDLNKKHTEEDEED